MLTALIETVFTIIVVVITMGWLLCGTMSMAFGKWWQKIIGGLMLFGFFFLITWGQQEGVLARRMYVYEKTS